MGVIGLLPRGVCFSSQHYNGAVIMCYFQLCSHNHYFLLLLLVAVMHFPDSCNTMECKVTVFKR